MPATFDGNDGNDGNSANAGGGGNSTSTSAGWFFADRVTLPFVTDLVVDPVPQPQPPPMGSLPQPTTIGHLADIPVKNFPPRNWSVEWYSWVALTEFVQTNWLTMNPKLAADWPAGVPFVPIIAAPITNVPGVPAWTTIPTGYVPPFMDWTTFPKTAHEIKHLVQAAATERPDALGEILSQSNEFISYFLNLMTTRPAAYPATTKVLSIASQVGTFVAMYFKNLYQRPRPSQVSPALLPPIEVPGHASFPSGHSTQAHLMALCMIDVLKAAGQPTQMGLDLWTLAGRIARNREIAGLHYPSDTAAGVAIARSVLPFLELGLPSPSSGGGAPMTLFQTAAALAVEEWSW